MNWGFLLFRGSYTYKKGLIVQSSSKTTQLLDPLFSYIKTRDKMYTNERQEILLVLQLSLVFSFVGIQKLDL